MREPDQITLVFRRQDLTLKGRRLSHPGFENQLKFLLLRVITLSEFPANFRYAIAIDERAFRWQGAIA